MHNKETIKRIAWHVIHPVHTLCHPVKWMSRVLKARWFRTNPRKAELILGLVLVGTAILLSHFIEAKLFEWFVVEPLKAVGGAPIAKLVCEALEWEA